MATIKSKLKFRAKINKYFVTHDKIINIFSIDYAFILLGEN